MRLGTWQLLPEQHPPAQLAAQSGQTPASQPGVGEHALQLWPAVPHWESVRPATQAVPLQQPVGQVVSSHLHAPLMQVCPAWHSGPLPHRQAPLSQRSAATLSHAEQVPPAVPQRLMPFTTHTPLAQQPLGQLVASHCACGGPIDTTTVVSLPGRARPSAEPVPTTAPAESASTRTVTVPA